MNNSIPKGSSFYLLNTEMTVMSTNYSYYLPSQNRNVNTIFAQGTSNYLRNDQYGQFTATYTWNAYFDPSTGYIVGYSYVEHDTNSSGNGFTYSDDLYLNSTSYPLTTAAASNPSRRKFSPNTISWLHCCNNPSHRGHCNSHLCAFEKKQKNATETSFPTTVPTTAHSRRSAATEYRFDSKATACTADRN